MGINASVGLIFDNQQAAEDNLASLTAKPNIIMAHVFDVDGNIFASYYQEGLKLDTLQNNTQLSEFYADHGHVLLDALLYTEEEDALLDLNIEEVALLVMEEEALLNSNPEDDAFTEDEDILDLDTEEEDISNFSNSNTENTSSNTEEEQEQEVVSNTETEGAYFFGEEHIGVFKPIIIDGEDIGTVYIISDLKELDRRLYWYGGVLAAVMFASLILALLLASKLQRIITTPIYNLLKITTTVSKEKDYTLRAKKLGNDEVGSLIDGFNEMLTTIENRIEELVQTRNELVQSEKMASLGRLVAGFAHELNTPIGIAVGSASLLQDKSHFLNKLLEQEEVEEDDLVSILDTINQTAEMTISSLKRAANLVSSFKRTAVDQTSEHVRRFEVKAILNDVVNTLHSNFKTTAIEIKLDCPNDLAIYSIPGSLGQIITNLMMNSLIHGFDDGKNGGRIRIAVSFEEKRLLMDYSDTGKGMTPDVLEKVFEPFFTTRRAKGGSGLGMYICYNIVTSQLNGTIICESAPGKGVLFKIEFPCTR